MPGRRRALRPPERDPGLGRRRPTTSSRCWPARWRSTPGSWSTPTTTSAGSSTPSRSSGVLDDTLVYLIIGDNGASAEGTPNGTFNEIISLNGAADFETTEFMAAAHRRVRNPGGLQPLRGGLGPRHGHPVPVDQAGGLPLRRDPQRDHRPLAQRLRRHGARSAASSTTSSTSPPPSSTWPGIPEPTFVNGIQQMPLHGVSHGATPSTTPTPPSAARPSTSRWPATAGIYHKGWTAVTRHSIPWDVRRRAARPRRRRLGALRHHHRLVPGPRPRRRAPRQARTSCSGCG